jgi:hypothetical protein
VKDFKDIIKEIFDKTPIKNKYDFIYEFNKVLQKYNIKPN